MNPRSLILGSSGKSGLSILLALSQRNAEALAFIHRPDQEQTVLAAGASDVVVGDISRQEDLEKAMAGIDVVYHICSNMNPDEFEIGKKVIAAAEKSGVNRIVFQSVLHPQSQLMAHHWQKLLVEEQLFQSSISFTILQPTAFMQNILGYRNAILSGKYAMPYPVTTSISLLDLHDLAEAAAKVICENGHENAIYELAGTLPLSQIEVASKLSSILDIPVEAEEIPLTIWEKQAAASGLKGYALNTLKSMFTYYRLYGLKGNPNVLTWLLGRAPVSIDQFLAREFLQR